MHASLICRILCESESKNIKAWIQQFKLTGGLTPPRHSSDYTLSYSRSSGPGGQNVNKLSTKATIRLDLAKAGTWLPEHVQQGLIQSPFYAQSTHSLLMSSMRHRTQSANSEDCLQKLEQVIVDAAQQGLQGETSQGQKQRVKSLIRADVQRTKQQKQKRGQIKAGRGKVYLD